MKINKEINMTRSQILRQLCSTEQDLLCGDIWVGLEKDNADDTHLGYFVQVEAKELESGNHSKNTFCVFGYNNILEDGEVSSDYSNTVIEFQFKRNEVLKYFS